MKPKSNEYIPSAEAFDFKDHSKHNLSKYEYDLYKEEEDIKNKIIRIKRVSLPNKGENWKIFDDMKLVELIEGTKLSMKEKEFLRTPDGTNFLLRCYKDGWKSFAAFKKQLKTKI